jgi:hypothetical protein
MQRLQVIFAYLFYRCSYYPDNLIKGILGMVRPPGIRATSGELKEAQDMILNLLGTIMHAHMRLTTHFIKNTAYGREFFESAEKRRRSKLKLPDLDVKRVIESLEVSVAVVRTVWYPLGVVVPNALWYPIDTVDSDSEEWETETPNVAFFRCLSAEIVAKTARLWTASQQELSTHVQVAIMKDISATLHASEWPPLEVNAKYLRFFRKGIYAPDNIDAFFDQVFQPKQADPDTLHEEESQQLPDKQPDGLPDGTTEIPTDGKLTQGSTQTTEATPTPPENPHPKASDLGFDVDGSEDIDAVIEKQINAALESVEVTGRPITFGSEFEETGGRGLGAKSMTEIMDRHESVTETVTELLDDTSDALLNHPYVAEEAMAVSAMCAGATAKYAKLRLEHENTAIMEAIWRLQQIVDSNEADLANIKSRIAVQKEKRKYWESINARMLKTYADINSAEDTLKKMEGTDHDDEHDEHDHREKGKGPQKTWQERARDVQHGAGKVGKSHGPTPRKTRQEHARETPPSHSRVGMKWGTKPDEVRSFHTPKGDRSFPGTNQSDSVNESQQTEDHAIGAGSQAVGEDKGDGSVMGAQSQ